MNREALIYKMTSVFIWALYPVFIAYGSSEESLGWFIVFVHISAALGAFICGYYSLYKKDRNKSIKRMKNTVKKLDFDQWLFVFTAGFCSTMYNLCFLYAMVWTSKAGVAVIIETAPVYAMLLTSVIVTKNWEALGARHAIITAIILMGVALVVMADQNDMALLFTDYEEYIKTGDFMSLVGCFVALLGSIMSALSNLMRAQVGNITRRVIPASATKYDHALSGIMFGESFVRIIAIPISLFVLFAFSDVSAFSLRDMVLAFVAGFFIFNLGAITYAAALLKSTNPAIVLLDYLSPPISIIILVILGLSVLHPYLIFGTMLIIMGNLLLLNMDKKQNTQIKPL
jgi:drug/metabolite transporter (DMT)-like permease